MPPPCALLPQEKERLADPYLFQEVEGLSKRNTALEESAAALQKALDEAQEAKTRSEGTLAELHTERDHLSQRAVALGRDVEEAMRARALLKVDTDATMAAERLAHVRERGDEVRRLKRELAEAREDASREKCARALVEAQARRHGGERDAVFSVLKRVLQGAEEQRDGWERERDELAKQCEQLEREVARRTAQEGRVEEIERDCAERAETEIQRARTRALDAEGMARHLEEQLGTAHQVRRVKRPRPAETLHHTRVVPLLLPIAGPQGGRAPRGRLGGATGQEAGPNRPVEGSPAASQGGDWPAACGSQATVGPLHLQRGQRASRFPRAEAEAQAGWAAGQVRGVHRQPRPRGVRGVTGTC